jgi:hypothetical protein
VCTKCSKAFKIGESRPAFEWKHSDIAEDSWIGVAPPEEKVERRHCIICDAPMPVEAVRCPACGANQVTGVVHRPKVEPPPHRVSIGTILPLRMIVLLIILACIGIAGYYVILAVTRTAVEVGDQLTDQTLVARAAKLLRDGGDEIDIAGQFSGRINQEKLPRFVEMLSATDPFNRRAIGALIACGKIDNVQPLMEWLKIQKSDEGLHVLHGLGAKRLLELASTGEQAARGAAAEGLCLVNGLTCDAPTREMLSGTAAVSEKIEKLNDLCRPRPEATGEFVARIGEDQEGLIASVEQIGNMFTLKVGTREFQSVFGMSREFAIPIEHWCAATGPAVDVKRAREILGGSVHLASPLGVGWEGTVTIRAKHEVNELPGYLPIKPPVRGETITTDIRMERGR